MKKFLLLALSMAFLFHANATNPNVGDGRDGGNHWTPDVAQFANSMTVIGVVQIDGVEQATADLEVGAFCNDVCRGTHKLAYYSAINRYLLFLDVFGEDGDFISFRLYDHGLGEELDVTCSNTLTFSTNGNHGNPMSPYVIDFEATTVSYTISASASPSNGGSVSGAGTYEEGQSCTLIANPNTGYSFVRWTKNGSQVSTSASYTFTVTENASYVAVFSLNSYTITASANPSAGGTVSGGGSYSHGSNCTLTATPNAGYTFLRWTKNGSQVSTSASYSFTVTENASYVAVFSQNSYTITASASPSEGGSVSGAGSYSYGETCSLTATPNTGYSFVRWTKNDSQVSTNNTYSFTVTENASYAAVFSLNSYTVSASANPAEGGSVSGGGSYSYGSTCSLTATANSGYAFVNWTENGSAVSSDATMSFTVTGNRSLVANFTVSQSDCHWIPSDSQYANTMTAIGVIQINGVEQRTTDLELGAFCNDVCRGTHKLAYYSQVDRYLLFLDVFGEDGDVIDFRLYDHAQGEELDVTCTSTMTFATNANHGTPVDPYVFLFETASVTYTITATANPGEGGTVSVGESYSFDDGTWQGWTTLDVDGDGYGWEINTVVVGHNGSSHFVLSRSWINNTILYPDNYLVSPQMTLGDTFSFYACGQDANYAAEHFGVAVSTTNGTDPDAFTLLQEWTLTAKGVGTPTDFTRSGNRTQGQWYLFTVDLSGYAGQTGYVAIRHFDSFDMFWLNVDDIMFSKEGETVIREFDEGSICTVTAKPSNGYFFVNWTANGEVVSTDAEYSFTVTGNSILTANFQPLCRKDPEDFQVQVHNPGFSEATVSWNSENDLFELRYGNGGLSEGFENGIPSDWATIDADGDGYTWSVGDPVNGYHFAGHNSNNCMSSSSYINYVGALNPDNYLVTPLVSLGGIFSFWACAQDANYAAEYFGVAVSTGSQTDPSDFTTIQEWTMSAKGSGSPKETIRGSQRAGQGTWYHYTVDLSGFEGQTGYIAIRHFNCTDYYYLDIDDVYYEYVPDAEWTTITGITEPSYVLTGLEDMSNYIVQVRSSCGDGEAYSNWVGVVFTTAHYTITAIADPVEGGSVSGSGEYLKDENCIVGAEPSEGYAFLYWTEDGQQVSTETSLTFIVTRNRELVAHFVRICTIDPENLQVQVNESNYSEATASWNADHDLFDLRIIKEEVEGFETGIPDGWVTIDADGDGNNWGRISSMYSNRQGYKSLDGVASQSYNGSALQPDNYLVSPQYELGGVLTFWACAYNTLYAADHFGVAVSTGSQTDPADFTTLQEWTMTAKGDGQKGNKSRGDDRAQGAWYQYTVDLSDYAGQMGYIAIRHFDCADQWALFVDDFNYLMPGSWTLVEGIQDLSYTISGLDEMCDYIVQVRSSCGDGENYSNWVGASCTTAHYTITASADPEEGGNVSGSGEYFRGENCSVGADPAVGYTFLYWTEDGQQVSTETNLTFSVISDRELVAHFVRTCAIDPENLQVQVNESNYSEGTVSWTSENDLFELCYGMLDEAYYDDGVNQDGIGANENNFWWGVMFPGGSYYGNCVYGVRIYDNMAMTGTVSVHVGGDTAPGTLVGQMEVVFTGAKQFVDIIFDAPVQVDSSENVWIVLYNESGARYPAAVSADTGDPNGRWVSLDGVNWSDLASYNLRYTFQTRALFADSEGFVTISNIVDPYYSITELENMSDYLVRVRSACSDGETYSNWVETFFTTKHYTIAATVDPEEGGSIAGAGVYLKNKNCVLEAESAEGYTFMYWTENDQQVSTSSSYSFVVNNDRELVAHFSLPLNITAVSNPEEGGVVEGAGEYDYGTICTLTATPNEGYMFVEWTENGQQVSQNASYAFTVTNDRDLVAHFAIPVTITVSADPVEGGTVSGGGDYYSGATCTLQATPAEGYLLINWTLNGEVVCKSLNYTFEVSESGEFVAHFGTFSSVFVGNENSTDTDSHLPDYNFYNYSLSEQIYTPEEIGMSGEIAAVSFYCTRNPKNVSRILDIYLVHTEKAVFENNSEWIPVTEEDRVFSAEVFFTANSWNSFVFDQPFVYNGTDNLALIVDDNSGHYESTRYFRTYGTESNQAHYIFRDASPYDPFNPESGGYLVSKKNNVLFWSPQGAIEVDQAIDFATGWNWWSSYLEMDATVEGGLKDAIATENTTATIKSMTGNIMLENGTWSTGLTLNNESMFMIQVNNAVTATLTAEAADPTAHTITLNPGWNWIGFPSANPMALTEALAGITPNEEDVIKGSASNATYTSEYGWNGSLTSLTPGLGYMYLNGGTSALTLTYPATSKAFVRSLPMERYWMNDTHGHATNMVMLATLDADRFAMAAGNYEIGAFVGDECRGSARLQQVGSHYIAYLTIGGENAETVRFRLYDVVNAKELGMAEEQMTYVANAVTGTTREPMVLNFRSTGVGEGDHNMVSVYPNPTKDKVMVEGDAIETVKVYNVLGQLVQMEQCGNATNVELHLNGLSAGVYTVEVTNAYGTVNRRIVKE